MLDIDFCTGRNCSQLNICQRYIDYLNRIEKKQSVQYARNGNPTGYCEQFQPKKFYGD